MHEVDLDTDPDVLADLVARVGPDELYNLGGLSSVARSWDDPLLTTRVNGLAALTLMDAARRLQERRGRRGAGACSRRSAEIFGEPATSPAGRAHAHPPGEPVRRVQGLRPPRGGGRAVSAGCSPRRVILYNHESPRRPTTFVTRKITSTVAAIAAGRADRLTLGNLDARRDWGWAPDYVDAMVRAARHDVPGDYVIATGRAHSVRDFVAAAFAHAGVDRLGAPGRGARRLHPAGRPQPAGRRRHGGARPSSAGQPTVTFEDLVGRMVDAEGSGS